MVLSRLIDRTHLGSWGFPDENLGKSYRPASTQYTFESPESLFSMFVPSHSPTHMNLAAEQADPSTVSSYPTQPLPTYFNVGRHLLRSDYGTFKLHSGRGGFTVGLSPWVYWGRLLFAVDWAIQNAPWWLWVINGAMVVWTVSERIYLWATLKISTLKRRFAAATGAATLAPLQRPPLPHPPYVSRLAPAHGMKSPSADLLGGQSPSEPGAFDVSISPRSLAGQIFTASPSGRAKAIETPNSNPSPTPRSGSFEGYGSVFPFAEEATPTPSSTPTSANDISKAGEEGNASFPTLNDMMHRRYSVTDVAAALPPRLLYDATLLFNTNIRVWSMAFGMASVLFFNAMANIDISEVKEGGSENDQLHVAVHVYHRFWLQSLLPFALCFGATLSRAVAELLSASSIRRASTTTSSIVIGVGVAAAVSMMGMRAEDRSPMRYARSEVTDTPWDGSYIRTTKSKKQRKSQNLHNTTMSDPERSKAILNSGQATSPLDQYLNAYSANVSYTFAAYGRSALTSLPPHAIVVTSGDQHLTAIRFQQWVLGYRADVVHIDRELAHYGWYRAALKEHRGISIQSPRVEPLLQSLLKSSWHVDSTQEPKGASPDDSRQKKTVKRRIKRRLFALEDATLTTSTGDYWRTIGTPVYAGWFYEIVAKKHAAKLKERLCERGQAIRQSRIPSTPLLALFMNGSSSASDVPLPPNEAKESHITMYSHPSLEVATIDLFGRSLPKIHGVIKCYHPWEAAVIQHYNLALKNAFLAEAVRFETQCEADEDTTPSTSLSWLSKRAHDGLRKEHFSQSVWEANVMPFLKALAQFL
eukprot:GILI01018620.1.p1 GENE.GILI01018620.1~~GILI01018620.1.p1  ORF type:complete len:944 (+),score=118.41 GILI01018620.1:394-2832(+)